MSIEILTFEEWDKQQGPNKMFSYGSMNAKHNSAPIENNVEYEQLSEDTKRMFYWSYVREQVKN